MIWEHQQLYAVHSLLVKGVLYIKRKSHKNNCVLNLGNTKKSQHNRKLHTMSASIRGTLLKKNISLGNQNSKHFYLQAYKQNQILFTVTTLHNYPKASTETR